MTREFAKRQIGRLSNLRGFSGLTEQALTDLINTLLAVARSEGHAKAVIDAFTAECSEDAHCPTLGDIRRVAWNLLTDSERDPRSGCGTCGGTGWRIVTRADGISGAERCSCRPAKPPESEKREPKRELKSTCRVLDWEPE